VAEDPLKAEDVATIRQECPGERVAQDVRRTARLKLRPPGEAVHQLIETSRGQSVPAGTGEERIVVPDTPPMAQPGPEGLARSSTNWNESLLTALPEHATSTLDEVQITDPK